MHSHTLIGVVTLFTRWDPTPTLTLVQSIRDPTDNWKAIPIPPVKHKPLCNRMAPKLHIKSTMRSVNRNR